VNGFFCVDWSREGRSMRHISAKSLMNWIAVFPTKDKQIAIGLIDALLQVCKPFGKIFNIYFLYIKSILSSFFNRNAS
jgi:hypothetical protein